MITKTIVPSSATSSDLNDRRLTRNIWSSCLWLFVSHLLLSVSARAEYIYTIINDEVTIEHYNGSGGDVTIPSTLRGFPVTRIGKGAFEGSAVVTIILPASVRIVDKGAFHACQNLALIDVDAANPNYYSEEGVLFDKRRMTLLNYPQRKPGAQYKIPDGVTAIDDWGINQSAYLTSLTVSSSVISIGEWAVAYSPNLAHVEFSKSVVAIGRSAFRGCLGLTRVILPPQLKAYGIGAFAGCSNLEAIEIDAGNLSFTSDEGVLLTKSKALLLQYPAGNTNTNYSIKAGVTEIADLGFYQSIHLTSITFPDGVAAIGEQAFAFSLHLTHCEFPESVVAIGNSAFAGCAALTGVTLPERLESIGDGAFASCDSLRDIVIPNATVAMGHYVFANCVRLKSITIGNGVTSIGDSSFIGCTQLADVKIGRRVSSIGFSAFSDCTGLRSITVPASVTAIAGRTCPEPPDACYGGMFFRCTGLKTVILEPGVAQIGAGMFAGCTNLESIIIPGSVASIGEAAFVGCVRLSSVTMENGVSSIGSSAFSWCAGLSRITLPASVESIGNWVFRACDSLTSIIIGDGLTTISPVAFYECHNLQRIYFNGNAPRVGYSPWFGANFDFIDTSATIYFGASSSGWSPVFAGRPAQLWNPEIVSTEGDLGLQAGLFGFTISGPPGLTVGVEASTDLINPNWSRVSGHVVGDVGKVRFTDFETAGRSARFYRLSQE